MFNIFGILMAMLIAEFSRGHGMFVGWESLGAVAVGAVLLLLLGWPLVGIVRSRLGLLRELDRALRTAELPDVQQRRERLALEQDRFLRRVGLLRRLYDGLTLATFAALCLVFSWPKFVEKYLFVPRGLEVLPDLAPYLLLLVAAWFNHWRIEREIRPSWGLGAYLGFNLRGNFMLLAPVILVSAVIYGLQTALPQFADAMAAFMFLQSAVQLAIMVGVVVFVPSVVRFILPSSRLQEGALRQRLLAFARARKVGIREIYIWHTRSRHIATAFVIGLIAPLRYVFLTDALMRELDEDEIESVFAHELGHAHYNHLWWLLLFFSTVTVVLLGSAALVGEIPRWVEEGALINFVPGLWSFMPVLAALAYGYFAFGYVSRRFERQADFFAVQYTPPEVLARVFYKLGVSSGHDISKRGWRHFSLAQRIEEIVLVTSRPEAKRGFTRELVLGMAASALVTLLCAAALWPSVREDYVTGRMSFAFMQFERARVSEMDADSQLMWRERVVFHAGQVEDLDDHNARLAKIYVAVTDALTGKEAQGFVELRETLKRENAAAKNDDERTYFRRLIEFVDQSEAAAKRARSKGTTWEVEMDSGGAKR